MIKLIIHATFIITGILGCLGLASHGIIKLYNVFAKDPVERYNNNLEKHDTNDKPM